MQNCIQNILSHFYVAHQLIRPLRVRLANQKVRNFRWRTFIPGFDEFCRRSYTNGRNDMIKTNKSIVLYKSFGAQKLPCKAIWWYFPMKKIRIWLRFRRLNMNVIRLRLQPQFDSDRLVNDVEQTKVEHLSQKIDSNLSMCHDVVALASTRNPKLVVENDQLAVTSNERFTKLILKHID